MAKTLIIDAHHHWMPEEHYRNPEPLIRAGETVVRRPDRLAIRREGVQLFGPPAMTADMAAQIDEMDRVGIDQRRAPRRLLGGLDRRPRGALHQRRDGEAHRAVSRPHHPAGARARA